MTITWRNEAVRFAATLILCFIAGGVTSLGQQYLPEALGSLANSAGSWTALVFFAIYAARLRIVPAIAAGVLGLVLMNEGYGVVSTWRGFPYTGGFSSFWTYAALVVGPVIGVAGVWMRSQRDMFRALAAAAPATVLVGEGIYGLTVIAATTSPVYWTISIAAGAAFIVWTVGWRVRTASARVTAVLATAIGAALFLVAYALLGGS